MPAYVLMMSHGDYDEHVEYPVAIVKDEDSAQLLIEALEAREPKYVARVPEIKRWVDLDAGEFSIDMCMVPIVEV